jgi:hypothetical protein
MRKERILGTREKKKEALKETGKARERRTKQRKKETTGRTEEIERREKEGEKKKKKKKKEEKRENKESQSQNLTWALTKALTGPKAHKAKIAVHTHLTQPNLLRSPKSKAHQSSPIRIGLPKIQSPTEMGPRHIQMQINS